MEKYQILQKAGSGNFSEVYKARNTITDEVVAIKQMKNVQQLQQLALKQLKIVSSLDHPNIIKVREIMKSRGDIKVVFEFMEENLLELYTSFKSSINQNQIKCILYQSALALQYLHKKHLIHRDIKPENILIDRKNALIKLIDFGLTKEQYLATTDYVATRWYRSPENLIGMRKSTTAIDIFALGCVAVELFTLTPLFPGDDTLDQLQRICNLLGTPTNQDWSKGSQCIKKKCIQINVKNKSTLRNVLNGASPDFIDLIEKMIVLNPEKRISAKDMLFHQFFKNVQRVVPDHIFKLGQKIKEQNLIKQKPKISLTRPSLIENRLSPKPILIQDRFSGEKSTKKLNFTIHTQDRTPLRSTNNRFSPKLQTNMLQNRPKRYTYYISDKQSINNTSTKLQSNSIHQKSNFQIKSVLKPTEKKILYHPERNSIITREAKQSNVKFLSKEISVKFNMSTNNNSLNKDSSLLMNRSVEKFPTTMTSSRSYNQMHTIRKMNSPFKTYRIS